MGEKLWETNQRVMNQWAKEYRTLMLVKIFYFITYSFACLTVGYFIGGFI